ncbi:MAG TPA: Mur ligase family protein, partial [Chloroflexota bacterium]|nr:Mur ligase family protein [Chloroflexota bacterium]
MAVSVRQTIIVRMTADERALQWLFQFTDWERGIGWGRGAGADVSWNLGRTRWLLDAVGQPDRDVPAVLIAGTKGKGSTAAMIESIARAAGFRTALYTQPHLQEYRERVRLDGEPINAADFARLVERFPEPVARMALEQPEAGEPTTYEITTALAMLAAKEHCADLAVIEVGLGGRLDATNCLNPAVSVLTRVSYDHTQILGSTLAAITREKVA